jgi:hypothetical protein
MIYPVEFSLRETAKPIQQGEDVYPPVAGSATRQMDFLRSRQDYDTHVVFILQVL